MKALILLLTLLPLLSHAKADPLSEQGTIIELVHAKQPLASVSLPAGARLTDLLFEPGLPHDIYWRSAQISNGQQQAKLVATKQRLLADLKSLQVMWMRAGDQGALVQSSQQLLLELDRIQLAGRLNITLDPAFNRAHGDQNPFLVGAYTLFTAPRSDSVYFTGLINGRAKQPLRAGASLADYWQAYSRLAGADPALAYLIQPTGEISQVPVANWNALHREPMAGATLFVGFEPRLLPPKYHDMNDRIAHLLANRIPE